jgi:peroxiredoxin
MKGYKRFSILLPTLVLFLASFSYSDKGPKPLKIGKSAPMKDYQMVGVDGTMQTLDGLKEENGLLVVFSCNTCPFVVGGEQFPGWELQYNAMDQLAGEQKIGMVLINSNEAKRVGDDSIESMKKRSNEKGYTMPYVVDTDSKLADAFGAKTTPHIYLFNKDMKLVYSGSIDNSWDSKRTEEIPYLKNALAELGKDQKITTKSSVPRGCSIKRKK